jgi:hypothetical protein
VEVWHDLRPPVRPETCGMNGIMPERIRLAGDAVAQALTHSAASPTGHYDDLAARYSAASGGEDLIPFETLAQTAAAQRKKVNLALPAEVQRLLDQQVDLGHRPIEFPDGELRYVIQAGLLRSEAPDGLVWTLPLSVPTPMWAQLAHDQDMPELLVLDDRAGNAYSRWLSLPDLIGFGGFPRMQDARDVLSTGTRPGHFYAFVSHRWHGATHPDPDGHQSRLVAWRLFGALCDAVRVARRRGPHTPRQLARHLGVPVGPAGSALAESILVNTLRSGSDDLAGAAREVESIAEHVDDLGAAQARADVGLTRLAGIVADLPVLRSLLGRLHVWYDYSCMPQSPRTADEQALFDQTLARLTWLQVSARTLILLDDVLDYLGRAWCNFEAGTATRMSGFVDVISIDENPQAGRQTEPYDLMRLVRDRQQVAWRGVLDTEVFRVQSPETCMRRLGLAMSDPADLPYLYGTLRNAGRPVPAGVGPAGLVTGAMPLPTVEGGRSFLAPDYRQRRDRPVDAPPPRVVGSLELDLRLDAEVVPSYQRLSPASRSCHVAVLASCEGEAMVVTAAVLRARREVESLVGAGITSTSWLAADPVPVGHRADGTLRSVLVTADIWVIVGGHDDDVLDALARLLTDARVPAAHVDLDRPDGNVTVLTADGPPSLLVGAVPELPAHPQGLQYRHFLRHLLQTAAPIDD